MNTFKKWEEEEKRGTTGTVPQLLFANNNPEMNMLKAHCTDTLERYKMINKAFMELSKDEKKVYFNNSKKNQKLRKTVSCLLISFQYIIYKHQRGGSSSYIRQ